MKIPLHTVEALQQQLEKLPPPDAASVNVSKQEAVRRLRPQIQAMRKLGYQYAQIAEKLTDSGLSISAATLVNYLRRIAKKTRPNKPAQTDGNDMAVREQKEHRAQGVRKAVPAAPVAPPQKTDGTFQVRPDSPDL
jgi:hypothetical protein